MSDIKICSSSLIPTTAATTTTAKAVSSTWFNGEAMQKQELQAIKNHFLKEYSTSISTYVKELERIFMLVVSNRNTVF